MSHQKNAVEISAVTAAIDAHSRLFHAPADWEADPQARKHGNPLRRAWEEFGLNAVLCVEGKPTVYFKHVRRCNLAEEANLQRQLWNHGTATMLVVEDPNEVRVYSALAKPDNLPVTDNADTRLVERIEHATFALELTQFVRRVETGEIYRQRPQCFQTQFAVDQFLLEQLNAASNLLCTETGGLPQEAAHALLGRFLFTCYLFDRQVIDARYLAAAGAKKAEKLLDLINLPDQSQRVSLLFRLFRLLQDDFNGSMFGGDLAGEEKQLAVQHIEVLARFLRGDNLVTGQTALFFLFDFSLIPIETVSAIYENFLAAEGEKKQRTAGAYYTPPRLAELAIDLATEGWDTLLDKRCLDPSCGSGVFLVILFIRMAEEWRLRNPHVHNTTRARKLLDLLTGNLCGVDVNPTACRISCFSLYLAFLDQLSPPDIMDLKAELDREKSGKVLPPLLAESNCEAPPGRSVIFTANFFGPELPDLGKFDLVIGNPPWVGRNQPAEKPIEDWIFSHRNPFLEAAPKSKAERKARFLPSDQSAIAFMWKAPLHIKDTGRVCLLLPSKVLLGNQTDTFQAAWFSRFRVDTIWQLADYRFILFEGAICPAVIVRYRSSQPVSADAEISYVTPKVERFDPRRAELPVLPDDQKVIPLDEILIAAKQGRTYTTWKKHFWGTPRDQQLIDRLLKMPSLNKLAGEPAEKKRFIKGQGFKPFYQEKYDKDPQRYGEPKPRWWNDKAWFLDARNKNWDLLLTKNDCRPVGHDWEKLHRCPPKEIFSAPMVLINQGCTRFVFSDFPVLFQHSLQSISGNSENLEDVELLLFLTALLNSPLAVYFFFQTSANLGVERDKVHFEELLQLPFPLPEQNRRPGFSRDIITKVAGRLQQAKTTIEAAQDSALFENTRLNEIQSAKTEVVGLVNEYFSLSKWEQALVRETVEIFEPSSTPVGIDSAIRQLDGSTLGERASYADLLCQTISGWARRSGWRMNASCQLAPGAGLALLTLSKSRQTERYSERPADRRFETILQRMQKACQKQLGSISYLRGFAMFDADSVHILKPLSLRHWTETTALNDADKLVGYMLDAGGTD